MSCQRMDPTQRPSSSSYSFCRSTVERRRTGRARVTPVSLARQFYTLRLSNRPERRRIRRSGEKNEGENVLHCVSHSQVPFFGMNVAFLNPLSFLPSVRFLHFPRMRSAFLLCFPPPILHFHNSDSTSRSQTRSQLVGSVGDRPNDRPHRKQAP